MAITNKILYQNICKQEPSIPLFSQYWWWNAVCCEHEWDVLLEYDGENVIGAMPYQIVRKFGLKYSIMPTSTQLGIVWIASGYDKEKITGKLVNQVKMLRTNYFQYQLSNQKQTYIFKGNGFELKERCTYRINDLSDITAIQNRFSENKKRQLKKAESLILGEIDDVEFYNFHQDVLKKQDKKISYSYRFFQNLYSSATQRKQGKILCVKNHENSILAAVFLVWDKETTYFLITGHDNRYKNSGAGSKLTLDAIKEAKKHSKTFDFEGSMIPGVANSYRQFGSSKTSYWSVEKINNPLVKLWMRIKK